MLNSLFPLLSLLTLLSSGHGQQQPLQPVDVVGCGKSKGCMRSSTSCGTNTCEYLVTWKKVVVNSKDYVQVEISGFVDEAGWYAAAGFGKSRQMGQDSTIACYYDTGNSKVEIKMGWNNGPTNKGNNEVNARVSSAMLVTSDSEKKNFLGGYYNEKSKRIECRVYVLAKAPKSLPAEMKAKTLDLLDQDLYVLVARGPTTSDGKLRIHKYKQISDHPQNLNKAGIGGSATYPWAKVHACFMLIAWVACASIAILLARYYKPMWPRKQLGGERPWFQIHRGLQIACMSLTIIAFVIIFVVVGGYSQETASPQLAHPILGIIITVLVIVNPIISLCRCKPSHPDRPWFNWFHWLFGTVAYVLSMPAIFIGLRLQKAGNQLILVDYPVWIMIFFVLFQFAVEIILEVHGCMVYKKDKDKQKAFQSELYEYQNKNGAQVRPREPRPTGHNFKMFMLGLHACVAIAVTFIMIIIVCVN